MKEAWFLFSGDFTSFLPPKWRKGEFSYQFNGNQSVKHLIEAAGVPHTEIGLIFANGEPVSLRYLVQDGDQIQVFPPQTQPQVNEALGNTHSDTSEQSPDTDICFVLDNHLGKLAAYLRMLGFDCLYRNDFQDQELAEIASLSNCVLLTRDQRLLMRNAVKKGYWLRSQIPRQQLLEVLERFDLFDLIQPFQRCIRCNQILIPVEKERIIDRLEPLTRQYFDEFKICPGCNQVYWKGSHHKRMEQFITELLKHRQNG